MATAKSAPESIESLRTRISDLESENVDLRDDIGKLENRLSIAQAEIEEQTSSTGDDLHEQLDTLGVAIESGSPSAPQTREQWIRCLRGMRSGSDWQNGTWR